MNCLRALMVLFLSISISHAEDWPQWLGPNRDGSTPEKVAPWKGQLKELWKVKVGEGHSGPIVAKGKVYLHTRVPGSDVEELSAFDADKGEKVWSEKYERGRFTSIFGNGPRATPCVDDGRVYSFGVTGILSCFDAEKGKKLWQIDTLKEFKAKNLFFGVSCSPIIEKDKLLLNVGGKGASIVAFDKVKGDVVWKNLDDRASYASPIVFGKGEERQAVFLTHDGLVAVAVRDGSLFWRFPFVDKLAESSTTPVKVGDMLIGSSITLGTVGLKLDHSGAIPKAREVWREKELTCYFSTPVAVGKEHLYVVAGTPPPALASKATLHCVDVGTGKTLWSRPNVGTYHASLLRTGDGKLLLLEEKGDLVLVEPDAKEYRELARSKVCGNTWAHPAVAQGRLFVRDRQHLYCVELRE